MLIVTEAYSGVEQRSTSSQISRLHGVKSSKFRSPSVLRELNRVATERYKATLDQVSRFELLITVQNNQFVLSRPFAFHLPSPLSSSTYKASKVKNDYRLYGLFLPIDPPTWSQFYGWWSKKGNVAGRTTELPHTTSYNEARRLYKEHFKNSLLLP
jgi:hypothetical protein